MDEAFEYAFPHSAVDESRRLELFQQRLDPLTTRRIERLAIGRGAKCLEIGGGRGSITRWLSERIGPDGRVTATDLQPGFLDAIDAANVEVLRHDVRTDTFPERTFDLVHARAVLMHIPDDPQHSPADGLMASSRRVAAARRTRFRHVARRLRPAVHPGAWHQTFPSGSLSRGRSLLRQIHQLGLADVSADAEIDIIQAGTPLAEFYRLSMAAIGPPAVAARALTPKQAAALIERTTQSDFLACGFVHIGVWGRRP